MWEEIIREAIMLIATIDPVGTLSLFVAVTAKRPPIERRGIALRSILYSGLILLFFLVIGQVLLSWLGVRLISFQVAGGIILFIFGIKMLFGGDDLGHTPGKIETEHDVAVFPMAIPSIANPGSILAIVLLTDNNVHGVLEQAVTAGILISILLLTLTLLLTANHIHRVIGNAGSQILIRVMGLLLAAMAVETVLQGIVEFIKRANFLS